VYSDENRTWVDTSHQHHELQELPVQMTDPAHYTTRRTGFFTRHIRHLGRPTSRLVAQVESRRGPITVQHHVQDQLCVALVVHKAQGATSDVALVWGENLGAESGYTALTRGRVRNRVFIMAESNGGEHLPPEQRNPAQYLEQRLSAAARMPAATDARRGPVRVR
jgi:hypothetical protein